MCGAPRVRLAPFMFTFNLPLCYNLYPIQPSFSISSIPFEIDTKIDTIFQYYLSILPFHTTSRYHLSILPFPKQQFYSLIILLYVLDLILAPYNESSLSLSCFQSEACLPLISHISFFSEIERFLIDVLTHRCFHQSSHLSQKIFPGDSFRQSGPINHFCAEYPFRAISQNISRNSPGSSLTPPTKILNFWNTPARLNRISKISRAKY